MIEYNPSKSVLEIVQGSSENIELVKELYKAGYDGILIPIVLPIYIDNLELRQLIEYNPSKSVLEIVQGSPENIELVKELYYAGYDDNDIPYVLSIYIKSDNIIFKKLISYKIPILLLKLIEQKKEHEIREIVDNIEKIGKISFKFINLKKKDFNQIDILLDYYNSFEFPTSNFHQELNLNIGIEIEGCGEETKISSIVLDHFHKESDGSIICPTNFAAVEFILKGYLNYSPSDHNLDTIKNNIDNIYNTISIDNPCIENCGIHIHVSSDSLLLDKFGLLFLVNLIIKWIDKYQDEFIKKHAYQLRITDYSYNDKNESSHKILAQEFKDEILGLFISNIDNSVVINSITNIFIKLKSIINKKYFFNIYDDASFIHIEYRGLATKLKLEDKEYFGIKTFVNDIYTMYQDVLYECKNNLSERGITI